MRGPQPITKGLFILGSFRAKRNLPWHLPAGLAKCLLVAKLEARNGRFPRESQRTWTLAAWRRCLRAFQNAKTEDHSPLGGRQGALTNRTSGGHKRQESYKHILFGVPYFGEFKEKPKEKPFGGSCFLIPRKMPNSSAHPG